MPLITKSERRGKKTQRVGKSLNSASNAAKKLSVYSQNTKTENISPQHDQSTTIQRSMSSAFCLFAKREITKPRGASRENTSALFLTGRLVSPVGTQPPIHFHFSV